jgi:hypothetical protein
MRENAAFATGRARRWSWRGGPLIALCLLLSSSCSAAQAQSWQCRAPEGAFADHDIAVPESATEFSGAMIIHKANGLSRWHPTAKVAFTDLDLAASGCHCNGVVATWYPEYPDKFLVSLSVDGKETPLGLVPYDKPVTFKLNFAWDGALRLAVGTGVATGMSSIPKRNNLTMSCSTADVDFTVTVAPPPPHTPERCPYAAREQWPAADIDRYCRASRPAG